MTRYGAIANAGYSHVRSMCAIGRVLEQRGHFFTLFGTAAQAAQAERDGIASITLGVDDPVAAAFSRVAAAGSVSTSTYLRYMRDMADFLCRNAPPILREQGIQMLLADQEEPGAATAADLAGIPYITICSSVPLNQDPWVPPSLAPWKGSSDRWTRMRNSLAYAVRDLAVMPVHRRVNRWRTAAGMAGYRKPGDSFSRLAQISQLVREIDFPRCFEDTRLHYTGPFQRHSTGQIPFPYERLDDRPLVYASFGSAKTDITGSFRTIADACAPLPVQLVMALGGAPVTEAHSALPGSPIVVSYAPQLDLLSRAAVFITHAGVNSVMEALRAGVPLIACPNAGDQFGMAARIACHGVGRVVSGKKLLPDPLRQAIADVLERPAYRAAAERVQRSVALTGGAEQAADIIQGL